MLVIGALACLVASAGCHYIINDTESAIYFMLVAIFSILLDMRDRQNS